MKATRTLAIVFAVVINIPAWVLAVAALTYPSPPSPVQYSLVIGGLVAGVALVAWGRSINIIRALAVVFGAHICALSVLVVAGAMEGSASWWVLPASGAVVGGSGWLSWWGWSNKKVPRKTREPKHRSSLHIADELAKLANFREAGVLSEEEFNTQKAKLLG